MIADDTDGIREALNRLKKERDLADLECQRRAAAAEKPIDLPPPKPLFSDSCPPFRGYVIEGLEPAIRGFCAQAKAEVDLFGRSGMIRDSNFDLDEYEQAWDEYDDWDNVTLDSGVTGPDPSQPTLFFWGKLDG
jgi:hypothetical protein